MPVVLSACDKVSMNLRRRIAEGESFPTKDRCATVVGWIRLKTGARRLKMGMARVLHFRLVQLARIQRIRGTDRASQQMIEEFIYGGEEEKRKSKSKRSKRINYQGEPNKNTVLE